MTKQLNFYSTIQSADIYFHVLDIALSTEAQESASRIFKLMELMANWPRQIC